MMIYIMQNTDTLYETVLFEPLKQIRVSNAMFKVASFIDFVQNWNHSSL